MAIVRLLYHDADVLFLDEPTRGIDVDSKTQVYKLINDRATGDPIAGRTPRAILIVSSYLPKLLGVCDRITVMCRGEFEAARPAAEWKEHRLMLEAIGQGSAAETKPPIG